MSPSSLVAVATLLFAGAHAQLNIKQNLAAVSTSGSLSALKYTGVGGAGTYNQVTNMIAGTFPTCSANPSCITAPKHVSGNLAPFDEELTVAFRGPINLHNIAVYQPTNGSVTSTSWSQVSSWQANQAPKNLVFMNNKGGDKSGEWSICGGSSQSFANGAFNDATTAANKEIHSGFLDENNEVNIMTAESCKSRQCDGFARGTANHGWDGSKMFVVTLDMPAPKDPSKLSAMWVLNAQVVRAAQYGCNCRGMGGDGGCGELDILEMLTGKDKGQTFSELYSFKGATGSGDNNFFARPAGGAATYAVVFDVAKDEIHIQKLNSFDYGVQIFPRSAIDAVLNAPAFATGLGAKQTVAMPIADVATPNTAPKPADPAAPANPSKDDAPIPANTSGDNGTPAADADTAKAPTPSCPVKRNKRRALAAHRRRHEHSH